MLLNDLLDKEKIISNNSETEILKRMLNFLSNNKRANTIYNSENKSHKNFINMNSKFSSFVNNTSNKTIFNTNKGTSFHQYSLPKIKNKKEKMKDKSNSRIKTLKNFNHETEKVLRISNVDSQNEINNHDGNDENDILMNNIKCNTVKRVKNKDYSPILGKSMVDIYKKLEDRESQSVKKSEYIANGIDEINKFKFDIDPYDYKYGKYKILPKKVVDKRYCLINLFKDLGKLKNTKEIEKTLFNDDQNNTISGLKLELERKGKKRIKKKKNLFLGLKI